MERPRLLIVEDDECVRIQMKWALHSEYELQFAADTDSALSSAADFRPPLVVLDLGLPPNPGDSENGIHLLHLLLEKEPHAKVIIVTGNSDKTSALRAVSEGAHDFFTKPVNIDELKTILKRAYYVYTLEEEYRRLQKEVVQKPLGDITGTSPRIQEIFSTVRKVATTDVPVLVTGESGTGKELAASAIHSNSRRRDKPFIPINCGAIPENLLESELFGHEKGAFTGAHIQRYGKIELAREGTLFLDEIGELPPALQVKLLRFLQDHKIERVGGREAYEIDVRVVAATNRNLKSLISEGRFREDLYYRLAVVTIELPPLRERGEDITELASSFLRKFSSDGQAKSFSTEAVSTLNSYSWPGNVRELENRVRRAITFSEGPLITPVDLGFCETKDPEKTLDLKKAKEDLEIKYVNMAILKHKGNISRAAEDLGLSRPTVHSILKRNNIGCETLRKG